MAGRPGGTAYKYITPSGVRHKKPYSKRLFFKNLSGAEHNNLYKKTKLPYKGV
jgi:hypothetical protein